jgi:hypothetical protein
VIRKLPQDAFEYYFALGPGRSHDAVAEHFQVAKRTVTALSVREGWQEKITRLEARAREKSEERIVETLEQMNERHLKTMKLLQRKGIEALLQMPITSADEGMRALLAGVKGERLIRGEPTDRTALDLESVVKREYERWMLKPGEQEDWEDEEKVQEVVDGGKNQ